MQHRHISSGTKNIVSDYVSVSYIHLMSHLSHPRCNLLQRRQRPLLLLPLRLEGGMMERKVCLHAAFLIRETEADSRLLYSYQSYAAA